jgi:hypothetical protein
MGGDLQDAGGDGSLGGFSQIFFMVFRQNGLVATLKRQGVVQQFNTASVTISHSKKSPKWGAKNFPHH